jgi:HlyD family secretion protein
MSDDRAPVTNRTPPSETALLPAVRPELPLIVAQPPVPRRRHFRRWIVLLLLAGAGGGAGWWWMHRPPPLPGWIAHSNGRLEADEIDIETKFAGRVSQLLVDEGATVAKGEVLALMDTRDLQASLAQAQSNLLSAQRTADAAQSDLEQRASEKRFATQQLDRARALVARGFETREVLDQRQSVYAVAVAAYDAASARLASALASVAAAEHAAELIRINIADNTLFAPKPGRIEYRLRNVGEVLPAGGKVFTMLDATYIYMDIFLPTDQAGRLVVGAPARIVLDAQPNSAMPARVVYVASQSQFTPKAVETKAERDKLMFRVRTRVDREALGTVETATRSGLPGVAYVLLDGRAQWPDGVRLSAAQ